MTPKITLRKHQLQTAEKDGVFWKTQYKGLLIEYKELKAKNNYLIKKLKDHQIKIS